ncbi:hypothetical protein [Streptomyces sp. B6B3]|uniref:hypothetical protein n=1 Tax=Streptomyces sp. B6B3 TaxID=3153570 RepID=UPI00325EA471
MAGVYLIGGLGFPTEADLPDLTDAEPAAWQATMNQDWMSGVDHHALLRAAPRTFAYGWLGAPPRPPGPGGDSPVAALAWTAQTFHEFNTADRPLDQVLDRDLFLTNVTLYWLTGTFGTSSWPMYDSAAGLAWPTGRKTAPTGVLDGSLPAVRRLAERHTTILHWPADNHAEHHLVALERPEALAADLAEALAAFFTKVR